jgi:ribokinase
VVGGKGALQAAAAGRLGATVWLVGAVGDDRDGAFLRSRLQGDRVDVSLLDVCERDSDRAMVTVDRHGERTTVLDVMMSALFDFDALEQERSRIGPVLAEADVVVTQWETHPSITQGMRALTPGQIVLNPSPAAGSRTIEDDAPVVPGSGSDAVGDVDVVVATGDELAILVGSEPAADIEAVADQARSLQVPAVVTILSEGAIAVQREPAGLLRVHKAAARPGLIPEPAATNDAFCATVAVALGEGASVHEAADWAVRVAGTIDTSKHAHEALPHRSSVGTWHTSDRTPPG